MSVPVASHPIKHLRTKLIAVAVVILVAAAGRLVITWVNDLLGRLPTAAAPKPPTYGSYGLKDEDAYVRLRSVQELGARNLGNAVVLAMFAELVATDSAPLVRAEAAKHVIMDPQAQTMGQVLFKAIEDENHLVRRHAVMALARIGDAARPAMSQIGQLLNDPDEYVCCAAATAIHILNADSESPITVLVQMLKDEDPITRQWAAAVLGDLRAEETVPYLREILQDEPQATFDEWKQTMEGRAREAAGKALATIEP